MASMAPAEVGRAGILPLRWHMSAKRFSFFVLCPVMIALPMGWYQAGFGDQLTRAASVGLWLAQWLVSWWMAEALLRGWRRVLGPWRLNFAALLIIAAASNLLLCRFTTPLLMQLFASLDGTPEAAAFPDLDRNLGDPAYLWTLLKSAWVGSLYWIVLRGAYELWIAHRAVPQFAPAAPRSSPQATEPPAFLARIPEAITRGDVIALEAEDHYVRVHFAVGSVLVHHRFADAVDAMRAFDGARVHRSFWVRGTAIRHADFTPSAAALILVNGLRVPVSHRYRALADQMLASRD
jgi:LytTr DNA-binding domain